MLRLGLFLTCYYFYAMFEESIMQQACSNLIDPYVIFRSSHRRCFIKEGVLKLLQNSQENTFARVFFNKVAGLMLATL